MAPALNRPEPQEAIALSMPCQLTTQSAVVLEHGHYPYLPPPGRYSVGGDHPLDPQNVKTSSEQTRIRRSVEIIFHFVQVMISIYSLFNILTSIRYQRQEVAINSKSIRAIHIGGSGNELGHGRVSDASWFLLSASILSMVMAISYFLVAWQTTTHRSQQSQDLNVHAEPACPSFQHISGHQHDVNPGGLVQTTLGDMPLENRSCSKLLRLPLARVWIMLSLVALTLVASVLQGLRIRRGIDCEVYGKLVEDYCRTTKTAVTTSLLASLLWLVWFTFWFLTSYCIGIGSNSGVIDDDATRRGTMMGSDDEIEEKENQDESPGVFGITTQISQGSGLQRRQDSGMGHTRISQLDRKEDVPFLSHQYQQRLPFVEDVMAQAALNTSRNGLDSNAFSEKDAEGLFISEADLFSISLDDEKEDVGDEGTTSSEQSAGVESHSSCAGTTLRWFDLQRQTLDAQPLVKSRSAMSLRRTPPIIPPRRGSLPVLRNEAYLNVGSSLAALDDNSTKMTTSGEPTDSVATSIVILDPTAAVTQDQTNHLLSRSKSAASFLRSSSTQHKKQWQTHPASFRSRATRFEARKHRSMSLSPEHTHSEQRRTLSLGRRTSQTLQSWFSPKPSSSGVNGQDAKRMRHSMGIMYPRNSNRSVRVHRSFSGPCKNSSLVLSLEDQRRLQKFREGALPFPPPPPVSSALAATSGRMSMSYFLELDQAEKERVLNGVLLHSTV